MLKMWSKNMHLLHVIILFLHHLRDILTSVVSNGFRFDGSGFVILSASQTGWKPAVSSQVSMKFKTYAPNGLLFFAGKDRDFISIELRNGRVVYQYDLGGGRVELEYLFKEVNDGEWHDVQVNRRNTSGMLFVDEDGGTIVDLLLNLHYIPYIFWWILIV